MGVYTEPVDSLRKIGKIDNEKDIEEVDYAQKYGLSSEHIPDLIRLATDEDFLKDEEGDGEEEDDSPDFSATIYALITLNQMRAEEAMEPLLTLYKLAPDSEWTMTVLLEFYTNIGPKSLPVLLPMLTNETIPSENRGYLIETIYTIGRQHPETRLECVQAFIAILENEPRNVDLDGSIIVGLAELKAVEALDIVEKRFQEENFDSFLVGDWDDFQIAVGVKEAPEERKPRLSRQDLMRNMLEKPYGKQNTTSVADSHFHPKPGKPSQREKNKAKMAKAARKKNRRK